MRRRQGTATVCVCLVAPAMTMSLRVTPHSAPVTLHDYAINQPPASESVSTGISSSCLPTGILVSKRSSCPLLQIHLWRWCIDITNHNSGHYPLPCLSFKTQLNSIGLSVRHRKHITSPLRVKQVNVILNYFVRML
jgi:hypothetical protein